MTGFPNRMSALIALTTLAAVSAMASGAPAEVTSGRLVLIEAYTMETTPGGDDIPASQREAIRRAVRDHLVRRGWYQPVRDAADPVPRAWVPSTYPFFPLAGRFGRDLFQRNFLDLDPATNALLDFNCSEYTYDGHLGHDVTIRGFAEKDIGVPVYSALDGLVVRTDDGHYDENGGGTPDSPLANHVVIDHGNQQVAYYWHLKNGSVQVGAGEEVVAGQQIGLAASSGWSSWPHLHFETHVNGSPVEPSRGDCNPGPSGWAKQERIKEATYLSDFAFSYEGPGEIARLLPWDMPRTGQIALDDPVTYFWFQVKSQPANAPWRVVFHRPDGSVAHDEEGVFATPFNRGTWWYFGFDVADMHVVSGTWEVEVFLASKSMGVMPLEVVERRARAFNRPPAPVKVSFAPRRPRAGEVLSCLVTADLLLDDPDYDVVRFEYEWIVNGEVVRRLQSAAHSDVLPRDALQRGDKVRCTVTPSDGRAVGPTATRTRKSK